MIARYILLFGVVSVAAAQPPAVVQTSPAAPLVPAQAQVVAPQAPAKAELAPPQVAVIKFEDASDKAGINFTHSFGSRQLGSLLEGTGAGCIWFD